jgi:hypothetical protein
LASVAEKLRAEIGDPAPPKRVKIASSSKVDPAYALANAVSTIAILDRLGIAHEDTKRGEMATCPGCGEDGALVGSDGGLKCLHDRCAHAGPDGKPGFRTNVDLVAEAEGIEALNAARLICEWFGIELPKKTTATPEPPPADDYIPTDADAPDAPPQSSEQPKAEPEPLLRLADLLEPAIQLAERRRSGEERPVPLPFREYADILCGGLWPGVHTFVAGTGAGKSTFLFQCATHAAGQGIPVLYIGLELSSFQVALRAMAEASGASWSRMYTGRATTRDMERARQCMPELAGLPFYVEFSSAHGWAASNLVRRAEQIRQAHPSGPMLVVLDFLQLVGAEPTSHGPSPDLRERIARASYAGVHVANNFGASVALISSCARDKYNLLASDAKGAALSTQRLPGDLSPRRTILNTDALIGVGKESGEIEFSSESQTVLIKWPRPLENGERCVIAAVPKLRYGPPSWVPFSFWTRFSEMAVQTIDELPAVPKAGPAPVASDEYEERVKAAIRKHPRLTSKNDVQKATKGERSKVLDALARLLESGEIEIGKDGCRVVD